MTVIYPILDGVVGIVLTYLEMKKGKFSIQINKMNLEIRKMADPDEEEKNTIRPIGFVISEEEENVDEDL